MPLFVTILKNEVGELLNIYPFNYTILNGEDEVVKS